MGIPPGIKIFADGAVVADVPALVNAYGIDGFTTNPTLMFKAGVTDYEGFAGSMVEAARGLPLSLEVFADEFEEMYCQALKLARLGEGVYVKIPVTNTRGETAAPLIARLAEAGVKINVTAVFTPEQIDGLLPCFKPGVPAIVSIFAGRIADAGIDPCPTVRYAVAQTCAHPEVEVLWASCREIYNVVQAAQAGCHIVTIPFPLLPKLLVLGKDLTEFSLDTVKMFYRDAAHSGYTL